MTKFIPLFFAAITFISSSSFAHKDEAAKIVVNVAGVEVSDAWARAGKPNSAAFMNVKNTTKQERKIVSASTDVAPRVELHDHIKDGDVMKMRAVEAIVIPAGGEVNLMPGGKHVMLFDLGKGLDEGQMIKLTLTLDNGAKIGLDVPVMAMTYNPKLLNTGCGCQH